MSRSVRKNPWITDQQGGNTKTIKRAANRTIRQIKNEEAPKNGKAYRKEFCSYSIRDWSFYAPNQKKAWRK